MIVTLTDHGALSGQYSGSILVGKAGEDIMKPARYVSTGNHIDDHKIRVSGCSEQQQTLMSFIGRGSSVVLAALRCWSPQSHFSMFAKILKKITSNLSRQILL
jgi:hypothetical protein